MSGHIVTTAQTIDGWQAVCAECDWRYESTSAAITLRAAEQHGAPSAAEEVRRAGGQMLPGLEDLA